MYAAVDLGTDGFRLHIGEPSGSGMNIVRSASEPIRLGDGIGADGVLGAAKLDEALRCLSGFRQILDGYRLRAVRAVASGALRPARHGGIFLPLAEQALGRPIDVISGEEEGRLIYLGVASALPDRGERRLVIDIASGSTEIVLGCGGQVEVVESFTLSAQRHGAMFFADGAVSRASFDAAVLSARARLHDSAGIFRARQWTAAYGASGTLRALAEIVERHAIGDGKLSYHALLALRERMVGAGHVEVLAADRAQPGACIGLAGGLTVLMGVMEELAIRSIHPVNAGLRLGVLSDMECQASRHDRRDAAVLGCMARFGVDGDRGARTAEIAQALFAKLVPQSDRLCRYLSWAAMLHEVGLAVSHTGMHRHGAYLVNHADLPGFSAREQALISSLILAHKGNLAKVSGLHAEPDMAKAVLALRLAVLILHAQAGDGVDALALQMDARITLRAAPGWLARHPLLACALEKEEDYWDEIDVPFVRRSD